MARGSAKSLLFGNPNIRKGKNTNGKIQYKNFELDSSGTNIEKYGPFVPDKTSRVNMQMDVYNSIVMLSDPSRDQDYCVVEIGKNHYASEILLDDGNVRITEISFNNGLISTCDIAAGVNGNNPRIMQSPQIQSNAPYDTRGIMLCIMFFLWDICVEKIASTNYTGRYADIPDYEAVKSLFELLEAGQMDAKEVSDNLLCLSASIQFGIESGAIPLNIPADGSTDMMSKDHISALSGAVMCGVPKYIQQNGGQIAVKATTFGKAKAAFKDFSSRFNWSAEEQKMIPQIEDDFPVLPEVLTIAKRYVATWDDKRPMKNFMWRASTSYGKSTGVETLAALLGLPLLRMTCHTNMETQDFLSSFVPVTSKSPVAGLPEITAEDMTYDPDGMWELLTGKASDTPVTTEQCFAEYKRQLVAQAGNKDNNFERVESNYIKGLMNGYMVEIQEASRIKDSGVLVGLNEYDRPGSIIPLVDGTYGTRKESALVVYTDNVGYDSCRDIDPSVLRRFAFILDSGELSPEQAQARVIYNTGCTDKNMVETLYNLWTKIKDFCETNEITSGSISITELEMWVRLVMMDGYSSIKENCQSAVISKATSDVAEQQQIMAMVEPLF